VQLNTPLLRLLTQPVAVVGLVVRFTLLKVLRQISILAGLSIPTRRLEHCTHRAEVAAVKTDKARLLLQLLAVTVAAVAQVMCLALAVLVERLSTAQATRLAPPEVPEQLQAQAGRLVEPVLALVGHGVNRVWTATDLAARQVEVLQNQAELLTCTLQAILDASSTA
jgi:hypothetical protein